MNSLISSRDPDSPSRWNGPPKTRGTAGSILTYPGFTLGICHGAARFGPGRPSTLLSDGRGGPFLGSPPSARSYRPSRKEHPHGLSIPERHLPSFWTSRFMNNITVAQCRRLLWAAIFGGTDLRGPGALHSYPPSRYPCTRIANPFVQVFGSTGCSSEQRHVLDNLLMGLFCCPATTRHLRHHRSNAC